MKIYEIGGMSEIEQALDEIMRTNSWRVVFVKSFNVRDLSKSRLKAVYIYALDLNQIPPEIAKFEFQIPDGDKEEEQRAKLLQYAWKRVKGDITMPKNYKDKIPSDLEKFTLHGNEGLITIKGILGFSELGRNYLDNKKK